jgi:DNA-binding response OmpR family regulator
VGAMVHRESAATAGGVLLLGHRAAANALAGQPVARLTVVGEVAEAHPHLRVSGTELLVLEESYVRAQGAQLCADLRALYPRLPLALLGSETTPPEFLEACAQAGLNDYLFGPLKWEAVATRLEALQGPVPGPSTPARSPRAPRTIAVAGDDGPRARLLADLLAHCGYQVALLPGRDPGAALASLGPLDLLVVVAPRLPRPGAPDALALIRLARGAAGGPPPQVLVVADDPASQVAGAGPGPVEVVAAAQSDRELVGRIDALLQRSTAALKADGRVPFYCPIEYREAGGRNPGNWRSGLSVDVSSGAIFVRTLAPPRLGCALELKIHLTTVREVLELTGVVAWTNPYRAPSAFIQPVGMAVQYLGAMTRKLASLIEVCRAAAEAPRPTIHSQR